MGCGPSSEVKGNVVTLVWRPDICGGLSQLHDKVPAYVEKDLPATRWWQLKHFWIFHPETWGRWTHFDGNIFQRGWNHQGNHWVGETLRRRDLSDEHLWTAMLGQPLRWEERALGKVACPVPPVQFLFSGRVHWHWKACQMVSLPWDSSRRRRCSIPSSSGWWPCTAANVRFPYRKRTAW